MRADMAKVVTERPRYNVGWKYHHFRTKETRGDLNDLPQKQGMRRPYLADGQRWERSFSDLINPLYRYIESNLGKPWDDVWSDICAHLRTDTTTQQHIRDHAVDMVDITVKLNDAGEPVDGQGIRPWRFYVDFRDGILKEVAKKKRRSWKDGQREENATVFRSFGFEKEVYRVRGIWYWAVFSTVKEPTRVISEWDEKHQPCAWITVHYTERDHRDFNLDILLNRKHPKELPVRRAGERYRSGKRQLSHRELKQFDLTNVM